ncbi:MAG: hypothetical protein IH620_07880 [Ignavibacterium sp.]|nr:hypothetical protein [Ignavibacterium sp.]
MKMIDLLEIIQDEKRSEDFLRGRGVLKTFTHCYKCNSTKVGMTRSDRWKCYSCEAEWTRRKDSILSLVRMKYSEFLLCMKFFELELTAEQCSGQLIINYKTANLLFTEFRKCLANIDAARLNIFAKTMKGNVGNISLKLVNNKVQIELITLSIQEPSAKVSVTRSRTGKSASSYQFDFIKIRKKLNQIGDKNFSSLGIFWRFAKPRLINFKGTELRTLILYLKEIEFRFNNSGVDIYDRLANEISNNFKGG